jgi:[ribosomal protein S5]-alanine N-acetyltransferase
MDLILSTARLEIVAATGQIARADVSDAQQFAVLLNCQVPEEWPPAEFKDAQSIFARILTRSPELVGWMHWYWILREERVLVGSGGFGGLPDANGKVEIGFSVVDSYHGLGIGTEAVGRLVQWASSQPDVKKIVAAIVADNNASRRLLKRCGFQERPTADDAKTIEYELLVEKG